jgi:hypothetical protein
MAMDIQNIAMPQDVLTRVWIAMILFPELTQGRQKFQEME